MSFIKENLIEINLGLKNEYKLIQISDVHAVDFNDSDSIDDINEAKKAEDIWYKQRTWFADKANESYDESHLIPSKECLNNLINYINDENPDVSVLSGDIIDYYSKSNYKLLVESIKKINTKYIFSPGNHETPVDRYKEIFNNSTGFTVLDLDDFKIVSLDDSTKLVSADTLNSLKKELEDDKLIIISMHIPISTIYNKEELSKYDPYFLIYEDDTDEITKEFIDILANNPKIKAILSGHIHGHSESYFAPNKIECIASSGLIGFVNKIIIR